MKTSEFLDLVAAGLNLQQNVPKFYLITGYTPADCYVMFHFLEFLIAN